MTKMTKITPFVTSRGPPCRESVFFLLILLGVSMRKDSNNIEKKKNIGKILGKGKSLPSTFEKENPTQIESTLPRVISSSLMVLLLHWAQAGGQFIFWVADWFALMNDKMGGGCFRRAVLAVPKRAV